ncbi:GNAT family N-acetyltransferase [Candidatus Daviesbacteria bacterium]|nr:GNAT family N-acetyltransferase [Candidatus Daviesbacteria bacterium]
MQNRVEFNIGDKSFRVIAQAENGQTVGCAVAALEEKDGLNLDLIQVNRCVRGQGIGKGLLFDVIGVARMFGARRLTGIFAPESGYENVVRGFYQRMGIEITPDGRLLKKI